MGLFDKVKTALNIGGAKLTISGPTSVQNGTNLEVKAIITGGKMAQKITDVKAELVMSESQRQYNMSGNATQNKIQTTLAQDVKAEPFDIAPGEVKEIAFSLPVAVQDPAAQGGMMGTLNRLNQMANTRQRMFRLRIVADIEGSADAADEIAINIV